MLNRFTTLLIFVSVTFFISSCGISSRVTNPSNPAAGKFNSAIESGVASWYGPNFHGKMTANGEIYNMNSLTAAHRTLPFDTFVRVENLDNNKSVIVRINDRGPFKDNRIIDLSKKAANEIDMVGPGTAEVQLFLVEGNLDEVQKRDLKVSTFTVQVGSFQVEQRAISVSNEIEGTRIEQFTLNDGQTVYRVYYGIFKDRSEAEREQQRLERQGYNCYVRQLENS